MKNAITILCIVAVTFVAQPVSAGHHSLAHAWEFQPQQCSPRPQDLRRQLLCSDPELRQADIALSKAYQEKIAQLAPAEVDACVATVERGGGHTRVSATIATATRYLVRSYERA